MSDYSKPKWYEVNLNFEVGYTKRPRKVVHLEFDQDYFKSVGVFSASIPDLSIVPSPSIKLKSDFLRPSSAGDLSVLGKPGLSRAGTRLYVKGIDNTIQVSTPKYVSWRKFISVDEGIKAQESFYSVSRVRMKGGYNPPPQSSIVLNWFETNPYSPPPPRSVTLEFGALGYGYVFASAGDNLTFGTPGVDQPSGTIISGFDAALFGNATIQGNLKNIFVNAFSAFDYYGIPNVANNARRLYPPGIDAIPISRPVIYNLRQYIVMKGLDSQVFGTAFLLGGVKFVTIVGMSPPTIPGPVVINTTANQDIKPFGIVAPMVTGPIVSPRYLNAPGMSPGLFGAVWVQRNPSPLGFINSSYGNAWISHSPRYLTPDHVSAFETGYPKIFDPTQRTYVTTVIAGGVFGDIAVKNNRRFLKVTGFVAQEFSDWSTLESTLRHIIPKGYDAHISGDSNIRNKSPSIVPPGINSLSGLQPAIGYRIRIIKVSGFDILRSGTAKLTQPPSLTPSSINELKFGTTFISNYTQTIQGIGFSSAVFGKLDTWFRYRSIKTAGDEFLKSGTGRIEHGNRNYNIPGSSNSSYGNAWVSFKKRSLIVSSIAAEFASNHRVGGTQYVNPLGYIASLFGSRIIPESRTLHPVGFTNPYGLPAVDLYKRYIKVIGFLSNGQEGSQRWGHATTFNRRQYITQFFDPNSDLVPPKWSQWSLIQNRNYQFNVTGWDASKHGYTRIDNNARAILPTAIYGTEITKPMIAERERKLHLQGIEPPHFGAWQKIYNDARVLGAQSFLSFEMGKIEKVVNTRRYFPYIGAFESQVFGNSMIAFKIRDVKCESRYPIAPPIIPLPNVKLHTRYVDVQGFDLYGSGAASLSIHWTLITPRWTLRNDYGSPTVKNLTPEVGVKGRSSEEFGDTNIRLQWRPLNAKGEEVVKFGLTKIADRKQHIVVSGFTQWGIGSKLTVIKTGAPPYSLQYIWLNGVEIDGEVFDGHGIEIIKDQVPRAGINQNVLYPMDIEAQTQMGRPTVFSNNLHVSPGIGEDNVPEPIIQLRSKTVSVTGIPSSSVVTAPRLSPWTIWAVIEAPSQAQANHEIPLRPLHVIQSMSIFGQPKLELKHRKITQYWQIASGERFGSHAATLRKRYIKPDPINSFRMGWHEIPSKFKIVEQYESYSSLEFGRASVEIPYYGPKVLAPVGIASFKSGVNLVEFFNRSLSITGINSLVMGSSIRETSLYKPQSLHVGFPMPTIPKGIDSELFGKTAISLRVRNLSVQGFDAFICSYDPSKFKLRMKVEMPKIPKPVPRSTIEVNGFNASDSGTPDIKLAVHYIRPDGNSEQYRKGVSQ